MSIQVDLPATAAEKAKASAEAVKDINKEYGDGAIFDMGDRKGLAVPVIPFGIYGLDFEALTVGGLPRGRIVEIYGAEGGGKCLVGNTYLNTSYGLLTIKEFFEKNNLVASCTTRVNTKVDKLVNRYGEEEDTVSFTNNGKRKVFKVNTFSGNYISSTENHPHLVISNTGNWVWRRTGELKIGDFLVQQRKTFAGVLSLDKDLSYALGVLIADGGFTENSLRFTNDDPCVKEIVNTTLEKYFQFASKQYNNNEHGSINFHFNSKEKVTKFYNEFGLKPCLSKEKEVGKVLRTLDKNSLKEFLRGYFDCEMSVDTPKVCIEVSSASEVLLREIKLLLLSFGIVGLIRPLVVKGYEHNSYWRLSITGKDARLYIKEIGTKSKIRDNSFSLIDLENGSTNFDSIPNCRLLLEDLYCSTETTREHNNLFCDVLGEHPKAKLTYQRLETILKYTWGNTLLVNRLKEIAHSNYFYDEITSIDDAGEQPTFDFEMSKTHSFIANGFITHNTSACLRIIANAQKLGELCAFIDAEHALDPNWATEKHGVDIDKLLVSQPDSGEQALNIVERLVSSGAFSVIVVDSVAALVPQSELNGEFGDASMGVQARMMSQAMRKLTGLVSKTNTILIFINQVRATIGNSWGPSEATSGGRALKFYASVRLDIRRMSTIKVGEEAVGNKIKIKVVKNKVAAPFKETEVDLLFDSGFDSLGSLIDPAIKYGLLEKGGSWFTYEGKRYQGEKNLKAALNIDKLTADILAKKDK